MTPRIQELFAAAREMPDREWESYLRRAAPDEAAEVLAMLRDQEQAFSFFDGLESELVRLTPDEPEPPSNFAGRVIGPYRIVREIGRGGMGVVYLAEREGHFEQQVAIKVIRGWRESAETLRRFLAERQILSRLQHAGIARLIDGGSTAEGTPYVVLEYVDGVPLLERAAKLNIDARLALFLEIGEAVEYAHRNLVVHRDLKPGNILIAADGHPKLLDFGIAKLLEVEQEEGTVTGVRPLTPEFAAPEQLKGQAITTGTDVYGLGMVLFELLSGLRPFQFRDRSWTELERVVLTEEASPLSRFDRRFACDLDRISGKALKKDPARRYQTVHELLEDIRRHRAGLPIMARGSSRLYRVRKFIGRNRMAVGLAAAAMLLTLGFTATLAVQSIRLAKERDKARQVAELFVNLFSVADPDTAPGRAHYGAGNSGSRRG